MVGRLCFLGEKKAGDNLGATKAVFRPFGLMMCVLLTILYFQIHGQFLDRLVLTNHGTRVYSNSLVLCLKNSEF